MTYTYTALLYHLDKETIFTFTSLPSGILSIDKNEDEKEAVEEVLMELVSDEEFLPHAPSQSFPAKVHAWLNPSTPHRQLNHVVY